MLSSYSLSAWAALFMATLIPASPTPSPNPDLIGSLGPLIQDIPILDGPLPSMMTKNPSPECASLNQGTRLCCQSTFDGDVPIVLELAPLLGYKLDPNSVNGIYCEYHSTRFNGKTCSRMPNYRLQRSRMR
jgi:hypothetical protein